MSPSSYLSKVPRRQQCIARLRDVLASPGASYLVTQTWNRTNIHNSIKKPKTFRYPSLKGTDPKFRRNHKHALHGTMRALKEVKEGKRDAA